MGILTLHPFASSLAHPLVSPLAEAGFGVLALDARSVHNQATARAEQLLADVEAGVRHLHDRGHQGVVLWGNSLGGSLMCLYQALAEGSALPNRLGDPPPPVHPPPAIGLVLTAAPAGPGHVMAHFLDPSVLDEHDPTVIDPDLDMYNPANGPPYARGWVARYRVAQRERSRRITRWCLERHTAGGQDLAFVVHRTTADPRFLDLRLDPSDRPAGTGWGDAAALNRGALFFGRHTTTSTWLSFWSEESTHLDGPRHLARTSCPALMVSYTADRVCFTGDQRPYLEAERIQPLATAEVRGGTHTLAYQPDKIAEAASIVGRWLREHVS